MTSVPVARKKLFFSTAKDPSPTHKKDGTRPNGDTWVCLRIGRGPATVRTGIPPYARDINRGTNSKRVGARQPHVR
jgi:hypothetical protein